MVKILVIGKTGQVASNLQKILKDRAYYIGREELDLSKPDSIYEILSNYTVDIIINAAAYTQVDKAEDEVELAKIINGDSVGIIADYTKKKNLLFIHYSTDYIFPGDRTNPIYENDLPNPLSVYGKTKLLGENNIINKGGKYLIIRTSGVYDSKGHNFVKTMLRLANEYREIKVVDDQFTSPTYAYDLAFATVQIIDQIDENFHSSIYNICNSSVVSWYEFAKSLFEIAKKLDMVNHVDLKPIKNIEYQLKAKRPNYSELNCGKLYEKFSIKLPSVENALERCLNQIKMDNNV